MKDIREKIVNKPDLTINRLPANTKKRFLELASVEDFCKDYGFVIKYLIDFHDGIIIHGNETMMNEIERLREEIVSVKQLITVKEETKDTRKMLAGNIKKIRTGEKK